MTKKQIALKYRKQMVKVEKQRDKLYAQALKDLKIKDSDWAWDYIVNGSANDKDDPYARMCWANMFGKAVEDAS